MDNLKLAKHSTRFTSILGKLSFFIGLSLSTLAPSKVFATKAEAEVKTSTELLDVRAGSQKSWSVQFLLNYSGPSIETPFSEFAPNAGESPVPPRVTLSGSVALRYRLDGLSSLGFGSGIQTDTPFHGPRNSSVSNPYLDYSYFSANRIFYSASAMYYSDAVYQDYGYLANMALSASYSQRLNDQWNWGVQGGLSENMFSGASSAFQLQQSVGLYPSLEYKLKTSVNLRTVLTLASYKLRNANEWIKSPLSQTLGAGWVYSADLFVYAYVLFYPSPLADLRAKNSSLGVSLIWNL